jgi:hypothetical protein
MRVCLAIGTSRGVYYVPYVIRSNIAPPLPSHCDGARCSKHGALAAFLLTLYAECACCNLTTPSTIPMVGYPLPGVEMRGHPIIRDHHFLGKVVLQTTDTCTYDISLSGRTFKFWVGLQCFSKMVVLQANMEYWLSIIPACRRA